MRAYVRSPTVREGAHTENAPLLTRGLLHLSNAARVTPKRKREFTTCGHSVRRTSFLRDKSRRIAGRALRQDAVLTRRSASRRVMRHNGRRILCRPVGRRRIACSEDFRSGETTEVY